MELGGERVVVFAYGCLVVEVSRLKLYGTKQKEREIMREASCLLGFV